MEVIEEWRDLSLQEWNFKEILSRKLTSLLHQQNLYRRQRGTIRWVKLGDENSKFFHANTTVKHRRNLISGLADNDGSLVYDHAQRTYLIWRDFKDRLGTSNFENMLFNLDSLLDSGVDLSSLEISFNNQEIDNIIKNLPTDKSPGPGEFNNEFLKR